MKKPKGQNVAITIFLRGRQGQIIFTTNTIYYESLRRMLREVTHRSCSA